MQAAIRVIRPLGALAFAAALAGCGGGAAPASSAPASSSPAPATSVAASKPAVSVAAPASTAASISASAKPAASAAAGSPPAKPAASGSTAGSASAKPAASGAAAAKPATSGGAVTLPTLPAPVAVSVDPKTTAFLILDLNQAVCQPNPVCTATVPAVSAFLKKARDAKMPVVYSTTGNAPPGSPVLPALAPVNGEQTVVAHADKFAGTDLDQILKKLNATTLIIVGSAANGAVMYTAFHANTLGYTVAVPTDGISSREAFATFEAEYQLLNQPGATNASNKPLADKTVTLTTTSQITIK